LPENNKTVSELLLFADTCREFIREYPKKLGGPDSVVGIATRYGLEG
jgi:hypothetical protein